MCFVSSNVSMTTTNCNAGINSWWYCWIPDSKKKKPWSTAPSAETAHHIMSTYTHKHLILFQLLIQILTLWQDGRICALSNHSTSGLICAIHANNNILVSYMYSGFESSACNQQKHAKKQDKMYLDLASTHTATPPTPPSSPSQIWQRHHSMPTMTTVYATCSPDKGVWVNWGGWMQPSSTPLSHWSCCMKLYWPGAPSHLSLQTVSLFPTQMSTGWDNHLVWASNGQTHPNSP